MWQRKWKCAKFFFEGLMTSLIAHLMAWLAIVSVSVLWQFIGHVAGVVGLQILSVSLGH